MRLTQIKLAGFKSFVDPTVIPTPSQLVGVVGPNGCGKSNIIDAVRWVLGESRASELRGDSMQDVIFSGSRDRKPAARASVELVFDNTDGRVSGQWSTYSEISVRRVLTRDGNSSYYINQQVVRRRDVYDIFLGTGLGARGYAIIGQGMINRLLEARPEDLRVYLEEAAGVSRYKERRRETENRLRDTRDNLSRVEDILQELGAQQARLQQQAEVAIRYSALQQDMTSKQHALWCLREQAAHAQAQQLVQRTSQAQLALEAATAQLRKFEVQLTEQRQTHYDVSEAVHKAQAALYESNAQTSSLEAQIRHAAQTRQKLEERRTQLLAQIQQWQDQTVYCEQEIARHQSLLQTRETDLEQARAMVEDVGTQLPEIEEKSAMANESREHMRAEMAQMSQKKALAAQRQHDAGQQHEALGHRRARLAAERDAIGSINPETLADLTGQVSAAFEEMTQAQEVLNELEDRLPQVDAQRQQAKQALQNCSQQENALQARLSALQKLQTQLETSSTLVPWLEQQKLQDLPRLLPRLQVSAGWEDAVEAVLQDRLNALQASSLEAIGGLEEQGPPARVTVFERNPQNTMSPEESPEVSSGQTGLISLTDRVQTSDPTLKPLIELWLGHHYVASNLTTAIEQRHELPVGACWVLQSGHVIDTHSVRFYAPDSEQAGMLARQQEMELLADQIEGYQDVLEEAQQAVAVAEQDWQALTQAMAPARRELALRTQRHHDLEIQQRQRAQELSQDQQRADRLEQDLREVDTQLLAAQTRVDEFEEVCQEFEEALQMAQDRYTTIEQQCEDMSAQARQLREQVRQMERREQEAAFEQQTTQARLAELERNLDLASSQRAQAEREAESVIQEAGALDEDSVRAQLQQALEFRRERETTLEHLRQQQDSLAHEMREGDGQRLTLEQSLHPQREAIMALQLQEQAARLSAEQYAEQIREHEVDRQTVLAHIAEQTSDWNKPDWLQSEVQRNRRQMEAMGAVNLAALEELKTTEERLGYLQSQHQDLHLAIETLEDAIRKIDRETRDLLQSTFDEVNRHFGDLFPQLFGGGQARLVMSGEQILDAGIQVMAQPPGKRNTTIQLLSGGEKALTAIALVFALFKLNPAPFCLLDEVDAPLDDANTERYARLVTGMSEQTQFLFISHNKIAMQMAKHLIGVTMQEQGVSRIVAVDMDSALQLAAQAA